MASSNQSHENAVELFLSTEPYKLNYKGPCNVDIKVLSKLFIVEPYDKETSPVEISVYSSFAQYKNILCHISSENNVALVFSTVAACNNIYDIIFKYQVDVKQEVDGLSSDQQLQDQILIALLNEAKSNPAVNVTTKDLVMDMLQDIAATAEQNLRDSNMKSELNEPLHVEASTSSKKSSPSFCDTLSSIADQTLDKCLQNIVVKSECVEDEHVESKMQESSVVPERLTFIESTQNLSRKRLQSAETSDHAIQSKQCKNEVLEEEEEQDEAISQPQTSQSSLIMPTKTLVKSSHFLIHRIVTRHELIHFISDEKNLCYPYFYEKKYSRFTCANCRRSKHFSVAHLRCDNESGEYFLELGLIKHVCTPVNYVSIFDEIIIPCTSYSALFFEKKKNFNSSAPSKSGNSVQGNTTVNKASTTSSKLITSSKASANKFVNLKPDEYAFTSNLQGDVQLIVYASKDKNLGYTFSINESKCTCFCDGCKSNSTNTILYVIGNTVSEYTVSWKNQKPRHNCQPKVVTGNEEKVLMAGKFKFFNVDALDLNLMTFPFEDENLKCHIYEYSELLSTFYCIKCMELNHVVVADVFLNSKSEEYVVENNPAKHVCEPFVYSNLNCDNLVTKASSRLSVKKFTEKSWTEKNLIQAANFELHRNRTGVVNGELLIFTTKEKDFCFKYYYNLIILSISRAYQYVCHKCKLTARLYIDDENGKYFVRPSSTQHRCTPVPYEPERTIVRKPHFVFLDQHQPIRLIVFTSTSHQYCHVYSYKELSCRKCKNLTHENLTHEKPAHATLFKDENNEECVLLSRAQHRCEPQPFKDVAIKYNIPLFNIEIEI